jgi:hypothetical protein
MKVGLAMSLPTPQDPRHGSSRWDAVITALASWPHAFRFCLILLVMILAPAAALIITHLIGA